MRYIIPSLLFLLNAEVISWLALLILMGVFLVDCWNAKDQYKEEEA